jgi:serine/threonine-protein kinase
MLRDYELLEPIAQGGRGTIYRAWQTSLKRTVAVKVLMGAEFANLAARKRFRREAETAATLNHPNVVAIYEVGEQEGWPFLSMELIEGRDLAEMTRDKPVSARQAAQWLKTTSQAVHYAHEKGIIHGDLKPFADRQAAISGGECCQDVAVGDRSGAGVASITKSLGAARFGNNLPEVLGEESRAEIQYRAGVGG